MRLKLLALALVGVSLGASADENSTDLKRNNWIEVGVGSVSTLEFKTTLGNRGWALAASGYDEVEIFGDGHMTKDGQRQIDDGISELALMRTFSKHGHWFYSDASIGVGYMDATLAENCVRHTTGGWFGDTYRCDEKRKKGLSIPMELDIAFGRYVGIGLKLRASVGPESTAGIALTIPLGGFAKK